MPDSQLAYGVNYDQCFLETVKGAAMAYRPARIPSHKALISKIRHYFWL